MRRFLKVFLCSLMVVGIAGCGGSASTEKQEAVVKQFFECFQQYDMDKLATICAKDNQDVKDITSSLAELDQFRDPKQFGQVFVDETDAFAKEVFSTMFVSYDIKSAEKKDKDYTIKVEVTMKDYQNFNFSTSEMTKIAEDYQKENLSELQEIYKSKGQQAMIEKVYSDIAPMFYASMKEQIKTIKEVKEEVFFTVTADGDNWLISKIQEYK